MTDQHRQTHPFNDEDDASGDSSGVGGSQGSPVLALKFLPTRNSPQEIIDLVKHELQLKLDAENEAWLKTHMDEMKLPQEHTFELVLPKDGGVSLEAQVQQQYNQLLTQYRLRSAPVNVHQPTEQLEQVRLKQPKSFESMPKPELTPHHVSSNQLYAGLMPASEAAKKEIGVRQAIYFASIVSVTVLMQYKLEHDHKDEEGMVSRNKERSFNPVPRYVPVKPADEEW